MNTNLTSIKIRNFANKIDPDRVLSIIASLHIKELERTRLLDNYIQNYHLCKEKGFNIIASAVGYPPILKEIEKYKEFFQEKGIDLIWDPYYGRFNSKN